MSRANPYHRDPLNQRQPWEWYAKLALIDDPAIRLHCHNIVWFGYMPDEPQPELCDGNSNRRKLYRALRFLGFSVFQARVKAWGKSQLIAMRTRRLAQVTKYNAKAGLRERTKGLEVYAYPANLPVVWFEDELKSVRAI